MVTIPVMTSVFGALDVTDAIAPGRRTAALTGRTGRFSAA